MFAQAKAPDQLHPSDLDQYLELGWFRMGQTIFTTNFVHFKKETYSAIWLRVLLEKYAGDRAQAKLFKQNAVFRTTIQAATITAEKENLYTRYKSGIPFQPSESLQHLLMGKSTSPSIYDTYEVTVYDGDTLIAVGYFDLGEISAEGIASIYDPAYKKYSLGKYLIYQKIIYCKTLEFQYFYPGYFVPGYSFFDYKLTIGRQALQFLQLKSQQWLPIETFSPESIPILMMQEKLNIVQQLLNNSGVDARLVKYEYFDANLIPDLREAELFDFPLMLFCPHHSPDGINPVVVFGAHDDQYRVLKCMPVWKPDRTSDDPDFYSAYLLKVAQEIYAAATADSIAAVVSQLLTV